MKNSKSRKIKVLIINSYSPNRGDSAVLQSMIDTLLNIGDVKISVSTASPQCARAHITEEVEVIPWIPSIEVSRLWIPFWALWDLLGTLVSRLSTRFLQFMPKEDRKIVAKYHEADIVLSAGGHHLTDINGIVPFFRQWYQLLLVIVVGKPTVIYAQTIGPFIHMPALLKFLSKFVLNKTKLILLRDQISKVVVDELKITRPHVHVTADAAFLLDPAESVRIDEILTDEKIDENRKGPLVGIAVYHLKSRYYGYPDPERKFAEYKETTAKIADYLIEKWDAEVIFVPMEILSDDIPLITSIIYTMRHRNKAKVLRNRYTSKETMGVISRLDLFIGAKTHSIIFALAQCVPTLCFSYHPKAIELMKAFDMGDYVHDIANLNLRAITEEIEELLRNKTHIKEQMESKIRYIRDRAIFNVKLVKDMLITIQRRKSSTPPLKW